MVLWCVATELGSGRKLVVVFKGSSERLGMVGFVGSGTGLGCCVVAGGTVVVLLEDGLREGDDMCRV